jgi:hypothetical protein
MKRLTLAATFLVAVVVSGVAGRLSAAQTVAGYHPIAHAARARRAPDPPPPLISGPVAYPAATHIAHHFVPNEPSDPKPAPKPKPDPPPPPPAMNGPVVASYYDLTGTGACGAPAQDGYQFASLILPCGARIVICNGSTCVTATMNDRGPYVAGRTFDLNVALKNALGCGGLCDVTWRPA